MSPLKRRDELQALSEDHHNALVIALRCRRLAEGKFETDPGVYWTCVLDFFRNALQPHFDAEESLLVPALEALGEQAMGRKILEDHAALLRMMQAKPPDATGFRAFGTLLENHVRYEERVVFEQVQDRLPQNVLDEIDRATRAIPQICPNTFRPIPRTRA